MKRFWNWITEPNDDPILAIAAALTGFGFGVLIIATIALVAEWIR
jgi:hypothetical protein